MVWPIRGVAQLEDALKYWREHQTGLVEFSFLLTRQLMLGLMLGMVIES